MTIRIDGTNTAANPGITGTDTDTGLQFGTDEVNIVTGGTTAVTVDSSQDVGIGTATPTGGANKVVDVYGAASSAVNFHNATSGTTATDGGVIGQYGNDLVLFNYEAGIIQFGTDNSEAARIDSSGRLLVSTTTSALEPLVIKGDGGGLQINRSNTSYASSGDALGSIGFKGITSANSNAAAEALIEAAADGNHGGSTAPSRLEFHTKPSGTGPGSAPSERMRISSDGSVTLGTINTTASPIDTDSRIFYYSNNASSSASLFIDSRNSGGFVQINQSYGDSGNRGAVEFYRNESYKGQISVSSTQVYYNTTSDYRLKENVADVTGGIDLVKQLQPRSFNFIDEPGETITGFVAHEVQDVVPNAVSGTKDGLKIWEEGEELPDGFSVGDNKLDENGDTIPDYQCLDQAKLVPVLTAALKEAIAKIETLETQNAEQATTIASFEARISALEGGN